MHRAEMAILDLHHAAIELLGLRQPSLSMTGEGSFKRDARSRALAGSTLASCLQNDRNRLTGEFV
jgi:hypothetical protein